MKTEFENGFIVKLEDSPANLGTALYLYRRLNREEVQIYDLTFTPREVQKIFDSARPSMVVQNEPGNIFEQLGLELIRLKMLPPNTADKAALEATKYHLEDMRKMTAELLGKLL